MNEYNKTEVRGGKKEGKGRRRDRSTKLEIRNMEEQSAYTLLMITSLPSLVTYPPR